MPDQTANELIEYFANLNMSVVLLCKSSVTVRQDTQIENIRNIKSESVNILNTHTNIIDERERDRDLISVARIISRSRAIFGVDNGLLHLAACTDTPIIMGFTSVGPFHREIIRNHVKWQNIACVMPDETLSCRFCQSHMGLIPGHKFSQCLYNDYKCCEQLTSNKFIRGYEKLMKGIRK
jgi:ADP-heptose:LPS heptosyltransferase